MDLLSLAILAGHCETGVHADDYPLNLCAKNGAEKWNFDRKDDTNYWIA